MPEPCNCEQSLEATDLLKDLEEHLSKEVFINNPILKDMAIIAIHHYLKNWSKNHEHTPE